MSWYTSSFRRCKKYIVFILLSVFFNCDKIPLSPANVNSIVGTWVRQFDTLRFYDDSRFMFVLNTIPTGIEKGTWFTKDSILSLIFDKMIIDQENKQFEYVYSICNNILTVMGSKWIYRR